MNDMIVGGLSVGMREDNSQEKQASGEENCVRVARHCRQVLCRRGECENYD